MEILRQNVALAAAVITFQDPSSTPPPPPGFTPVSQTTSIWPAVILYGSLLLVMVFAAGLLSRSFRGGLRGIVCRLFSFVSGLFLLRRIKAALVIGYLACASFAALYIPWHRQGTLAWQHDVPLGFNFVWEYGLMGPDARPAYGLIAVEQVGIFLGFAAVYKLAVILYDALT